MPSIYMTPIVPWKGKSLTQILSIRQATADTNQSTNTITYMKARPIKHIYRKEIVTYSTVSNTHPPVGNPNLGVSIDEINSPNGYLLKPSQSSTCVPFTGNPLSISLETPISESYDCSLTNTTNACNTSSTSTSNTCFSTQLDARRRCRSAGMIQRNKTYYTDNKQLLHSRGKSFIQNQVIHIRQGYANLTPGSVGSQTNVYSANTISYCKLATISATLGNNLLTYIWLDGTSHTITIPDGNYDIGSYQNAVSTAMIMLGHYYYSLSSNARSVLVVFSYNTQSGRVELLIQGTFDFPSLHYAKGGIWTATQSVPQIVVSSANATLFGFGATTYPLNATSITNDQLYVATSVGLLLPNYVAVHYKPNNSQYATQGGVDSSSRIARLKYNAITNNGYAYRQSLGASVADALAYNVMIPGYNAYTLKDKIGYPMTKIPSFPKYPTQKNTVMQQCIPTRFSNM